MQRVTAATSTVLLVVLTLAVAEATLLLLLLIFASTLRLYVVVQLGPQFLQLAGPYLVPVPNVGIHHAGTIGSFLFTFACGIGAATWRYRHWKPSA